MQETLGKFTTKEVDELLERIINFQSGLKDAGNKRKHGENGERVI